MHNDELTQVQKFSHLISHMRRIALGDGNNDHPFFSPSQIALIEQVSQKEGIPLLEIADGLKVTAPTVSVSIKRLEEMGMVERKINPADKRSVLFFLTIKGRLAHGAMQTLQQQKLASFLSRLTQTEQDILYQLLSKAFQLPNSKK